MQRVPRQLQVRPSQVGCYVGTPAHYDVTKPGIKPVWFDRSLLHHCHLLVMQEGARPSHQKLAAVLRGMYEFHHPDGLADINSDPFRKLLGPALREYSMLRSKLDHVINLDVQDYPAEGPVAQCPACQGVKDVPAAHFDGCFKQGRLNSAKLQGESEHNRGRRYERHVWLCLQ